MTESDSNKWMQMLREFAPEIAALPEWGSRILVQDMAEAVRNRIAVIRRCQQQNEGNCK
ncbi:MAG: hypothetical protein ACE14S_09260 [Candidatus Bathyarchaeia archaeon]